MGFFDKLKEIANKNKKSNEYLNGFSKTSNAFGKSLRFITENNTLNQEDFLEKLMVALIESDIGYRTAEEICNRLYDKNRQFVYNLTIDKLLDLLTETLYEIYNPKNEKDIVYNPNGPTVILVVGVNGSGKTSVCAKLANMYKNQGKKVCLVAADTFRAGATEQLNEWAKRIGVDIVTGKEQQDPSSVLVDGCRFAKENDIDILICDTAGRLQNKVNLMHELAKMHKVVGREIEGAPHNSWLVIDSNTGQNGLSQAELFNEITDLNGIILTKTDGTSKGGIIVAIKNIIGVPVRFITFGENVEAIEPFNLDLYLYSITEGLSHVK